MYPVVLCISVLPLQWHCGRRICSRCEQVLKHDVRWHHSEKIANDIISKLYIYIYSCFYQALVHVKYRPVFHLGALFDKGNACFRVIWSMGNHTHGEIQLIWFEIVWPEQKRRRYASGEFSSCRKCRGQHLPVWQHQTKGFSRYWFGRI